MTLLVNHRTCSMINLVTELTYKFNKTIIATGYKKASDRGYIKLKSINLIDYQIINFFKHIIKKPFINNSKATPKKTYLFYLLLPLIINPKKN